MSRYQPLTRARIDADLELIAHYTIAFLKSALAAKARARGQETGSRAS
jgi:hypothetical protein